MAADRHLIRRTRRSRAAGVLLELGELAPLPGDGVENQDVAAEAVVFVLYLLLFCSQRGGRPEILGTDSRVYLSCQSLQSDEALAVRPAEDQQAVRPDSCSRAGHHASRLSVALGLDVGQLGPLVGLRVKLVGIGEHAPVARFILRSATENIEAVRRAVALAHRNEMRPRWAVPRRLRFPLEIVRAALGQVECPEIFRRTLTTVSAGDVDFIPDQRAGSRCGPLRQIRKIRVHRDAHIVVRQHEHLG